MTKDKDRDDALIAEVAEMFPPDTVDVQSRYVIVHQLRASADIQDAQTKRETGWADTSDRACLMRKAADALDALLAKLQPAPKPDRAKVLAQALWDQWTLKASEVIDAQSLINDAFNELRAEWEAERLHGTDWFKGEVDCDGNELVTVSKDALDRYKDQARYTYQRAEKAEARVKKLEAERPAVVVPREVKLWADSVGYCSATRYEERTTAKWIKSLNGAKGGE